MADKSINNREKIESLINDSTIESKHDLMKESRLKGTSKELLGELSDIVESAETSEQSESTEGNIGESVKEGKKRFPSGGAASSQSKSQEPSIDIMRIQVATKINKEIKILEKEAAKLMAGGSNFAPHDLNIVISKIRTLREMLANLAYATAETIRLWWMKHFKGAS